MARNKYDIDEVMEDKFDFSQLKRVFQYVKPYRGQLAFALFLLSLIHISEPTRR